jgi:hypothetical protein
MRYVLPLLIAMICPLMMFFMMRGAHGSHDSAAHASEHDDRCDPVTQTGLPTLDELRSSRDDLEARLDELDARIDELQQTELERPHRMLART